MDSINLVFQQLGPVLGVLAVFGSVAFWLASLRAATTANTAAIQDVRVELGKQGQRLNTIERDISHMDGKLDVLLERK